MAVKVKVIANVTIYDLNKTYGEGAVFDYHGKSAEKLAALGYVEIIGSSPDTESKADPKPEPETPKAEKPKK
jgi:protein tyrosine phosphatase (PTP) superfamily phosphohydrolase (DUF442 family)